MFRAERATLDTAPTIRTPLVVAVNLTIRPEFGIHGG
jgi:hypothetical protein